MKRLFLTALLLGWLWPTDITETTTFNGYEAAANRLVLKIAEDQAPLLGEETPLSFSAISDSDRNFNGSGITSFVPLYIFYQDFTDLHYTYNLHQYYVIEFTERVSLESMIADLYTLEAVELVEPDYVVRANIVPNDQYYPEQWGHNNTGQAGSGNVGIPDCDTDTDDAWDITTGDSDIIVAILDTGINGNHSEFAGKMVPGYDFVNNDNDGSDDNGHGTSCAGISAARGNNGSGIAGVSWESGLMPVKVLNSGGSGGDTGIANGIMWASDNGARIVSMSLSGGGFAQYTNDAVDYAVANGTVVFAATGNDNNNQVGYPSGYDNCIAVGALSPCNERKNPLSCDGENWWGSNFGSDLDFLAPGVLIYATTMSGGYMSNFNGTSSACPHAAGIGALILSASPSLSPEQVRSIMQLTADDIGSPGWDNETGYGRLNALASVSYSMSTPEILMDVDAISFDMEQGEMESFPVAIANVGDDDLTYSIDPQGYTWTDSFDDYIEYEWIDIEGIGTQIPFTHNDQAGPTYDLDFDFPFYGISYDEFFVNANGWIGFGEDSDEWDNIAIPSPDAPRPAVMGYWDDLNPNNSGNSNLMSGDVYYHSNAERLVVWFDHVVHWYGSNSIEGTYDFQMVLYPDGSIKFNYRSMEGEIELGTIGVQNETGEEGILISYNQDYAQADQSLLIQPRHPWVTVTPLDAVIPSGDGIELTIEVDATGVAPGLYYDWIVLNTNDYANLHPEIVLTINVGGTDCSGWTSGDVNQDGSLNVQDIVIIVNIVIGTLENPPDCQVWSADLNGDLEINVLDIVTLLNIILEG
ncbi:MAG: S8 family serine peptidase [FCB group bacterium]|nr:S8 family serine peptidase [FCB group bacterium]